MHKFITVENVFIEFPLFNTPNRSIKNSLISMTTGGAIKTSNSGFTVVKALNNINLHIKEGDKVAILGPNGAGKSTLLRTLSGIYEPQLGKIKRQGKVVTLIDLTLGMDSDATGYENIFLRGVLFGLSKKEINLMVQDIINFSELGDFIDLPLRTYSSGMVLRLAFSIATSINCDILIMDEWLSVGDASFQKKSTDRMNEFINKTKILIMATHSEELAKNLCNRVFRLNNGNLSEI